MAANALTVQQLILTELDKISTIKGKRGSKEQINVSEAFIKYLVVNYTDLTTIAPDDCFDKFFFDFYMPGIY